MPKHKPARKAPSIDMTAMTDVAFLLLTFFMLTAKMKPQEAVAVDTPSSISETKLPESNTLSVIVSKEGEVFLDPSGSQTRLILASEMNKTYSLGLTEEDSKRFVNCGSFGVSRQALKNWLRWSPAERGEMQKKPKDERVKLGLAGIPIDTADVNKSELANWIHAARLAQRTYKNQLLEAGKTTDQVKDYVIVVKADKDTPYPAIRSVINTLTDIDIHKFNLITSMEADPNKKPGGGE